MVRPLPVLLAVVAGFAVAASCYSERLAPPTFRYSCNSDADCDDTERCMTGLCQVPCSQATASDVCTLDNHLLCFNGACATGCDPADSSPCPKPQQCADLGITVSSSGFGGGGPEQKLGACGIACTENSCPEGEVCLEGFCLALCADGECPATFVCQMGVCIPEGATTGGADDDDDGGPSDDAASDDAATGETATDGDSTASSGGAT